MEDYSQNHEEQIDEENALTMEMLLHGFIDTFQQANYADYPDQVLTANKNHYEIMYYPDQYLIRVLTNSLGITAESTNKKITSKDLGYYLQNILHYDLRNIL